jgi:hypothetical protein
MFKSIEKALRYVTMLRIGDPMPAELLTGRASWAFEDRHIENARQRVTMQLVCSVSGREDAVNDPAVPDGMPESSEIEIDDLDAFEQAAKKLGLSSREQVVTKIEELAYELAYIEALRELYLQIFTLQKKLQMIYAEYKNQVSTKIVIESNIRLIKVPIKSMASDFEMVDRQTVDILSVLKNLDVEKAHICKQRDELHRRLMVWREILKSWDSVRPGVFPPNLMELVQELYRFMAPRFMPIDEWVLLLQDLNMPKKSTAMTW